MRKRHFLKLFYLSVIFGIFIIGGNLNNLSFYAPSVSQNGPKLAYVEGVYHKNSSRNHIRMTFIIELQWSRTGGSKTEIHEYMDNENHLLRLNISRSIVGYLTAIENEEISYFIRFHDVGEWTVEINNYTTKITVLENRISVLILTVLASSIIIGVAYSILIRLQRKKRTLKNFNSVVGNS
jgi:hypothetical protein